MFEKLIPLGIILIIFGIIVIVIGSVGSIVTDESDVKGGGLVLIGPVPIIFGTDKRITLILSVIALIIMILWFWGMKK